jgi:Sulfotransferase domain
MVGAAMAHDGDSQVDGDSRRLPEFFVVGHPKCGTTAMYEMLRRHPQVYTATGKKETGFFAVQSKPSQPQTLDEYLALFAPAEPEQRTGELTTSYLRSETAARQIAELQPDARIIALFREPASFVRSLHLQLLRERVEDESDLRRAIELEASRREGRHVPPGCPRPSILMYCDFIEYVEQLRRYHRAFSRDQVLVLTYDDYRRDNAATMRKILRFIGVDDTASVEVFDAHPSVRVRSQTAHGMLRATVMGRGRAGRFANAALKSVSSRPIRQKAFMFTRNRLLFGKPRAPDQELMLELRRRFRPEVVAFSEYLGRDLVDLWGYDDLG